MITVRQSKTMTICKRGSRMLINDDGIELSAELEVPEEYDGHRLVILLHGFTSTKDRPHNIRAATAMRDAGFATLRFDLYGHGESGGDFRNHTLFKWISNTIAVINWALTQGYDDLYLSGHSQGGLVAALVAGMEPDRIHGLILRAPAFMIPQGARDGVLLGESFDPDHVPEEIDAIKGLKLSGDYLRVAQTIHVEEAVDRFNGPVLILHGDKDDTVPLEDSKKYAKRYACCELTILDGETHHFDQNPERMENLIWGWMNELDEFSPEKGKKAAATEKKVVSLSVISEAIEETMDEWEQFYNVVTGEITSIPSQDNSFIDWSEYGEESEAIDESDDYVRLPSQDELHEYDIMESFAEARNSTVLMKALRGRKPFRTFKDRAIELGLDQAYFEFRSQAYVNIAREWCRKNEIPFTE